eukprot:13423873-Alexandrium_andersonii.AAC.1
METTRALGRVLVFSFVDGADGAYTTIEIDTGVLRSCADMISLSIFALYLGMMWGKRRDGAHDAPELTSSSSSALA